jgi:YD repeat-containing protein
MRNSKLAVTLLDLPKCRPFQHRLIGALALALGLVFVACSGGGAGTPEEIGEVTSAQTASPADRAYIGSIVQAATSWVFSANVSSCASGKGLVLEPGSPTGTLCYSPPGTECEYVTRKAYINVNFGPPGTIGEAGSWSAPQYNALYGTSSYVASCYDDKIPTQDCPPGTGGAYSELNEDSYIFSGTNISAAEPNASCNPQAYRAGYVVRAVRGSTTAWEGSYSQPYPSRCGTGGCTVLPGSRYRNGFGYCPNPYVAYIEVPANCAPTKNLVTPETSPVALDECSNVGASLGAALGAAMNAAIPVRRGNSVNILTGAEEKAISCLSIGAPPNKIHTTLSYSSDRALSKGKGALINPGDQVSTRSRPQTGASGLPLKLPSGWQLVGMERELRWGNPFSKCGINYRTGVYSAAAVTADSRPFPECLKFCDALAPGAPQNVGNGTNGTCVTRNPAANDEQRDFLTLMGSGGAEATFVYAQSTDAYLPIQGDRLATMADDAWGYIKKVTSGAGWVGPGTEWHLIHRSGERDVFNANFKLIRRQDAYGNSVTVTWTEASDGLSGSLRLVEQATGIGLEVYATKSAESDPDTEGTLGESTRLYYFQPQYIQDIAPNGTPASQIRRVSLAYAPLTTNPSHSGATPLVSITRQLDPSNPSVTSMDRYEWDPLGTLMRSQSPTQVAAGNPDSGQWWKYEYREQRMVRETLCAATATPPSTAPGSTCTVLFAREFFYSTDGVTGNRTVAYTTTTRPAYNPDIMVAADCTPTGCASTSLVEQAVFDKGGRMLQQFNPLTPTSAQTIPSVKSVIARDPSTKRATTVTDQIGRVTSYAYDAVGRVTTVTSDPGGPNQTVTTINPTGPFDQPLSLTVAAGTAAARLTKFSYRASDGAMLTSTRCATTACTGTNAYTTTFAVNTQGRLTGVTMPDGTVVNQTYDSRGYPTVSTLDPTGLNLSSSQVTDWRGYPVSATDPRGVVTTVTPDLAGRITRVALDPAGRNVVSTATYDGEDNLTAAVADATALKIRSTLGYGKRSLDGSLLLTVGTAGNVDPGGTATPAPATGSTSYDNAGHPVALIDPLNRSTIRGTVYNANGTVTLTTALPGRGAPRVTILDASGQVASTTDERGMATTYSYNSVGRLSTVTVGAQSSGAVPVTYTTTYNADGSVATTTNPASGYVKSVSYDGFGQPTLVTESGSGVATPIVTAYSYPSNGVGYGRGLVQSTSLGGVLTTFTYDRAGRLVTQVVDPAGVGATTNYQYVEGAESDKVNLRRVIDPKGNITRYRYNSLGLLDQTTDTAGGIFSYTYDNLGRLVQQAGPGNAQYWSYDALGRRKAAAMNGSNATTGTFPEVWHYNTDGAIKAYCPPSAAGPCGLSPASATAANGAWVYSYDAAGRTAGIDYPEVAGVTTADASYTYLANDLLASVTDASGKTAYTYDALNRVAVSARCSVLGCTPDVVSDSTANNKRLVYSYKANDTTLASLQYWNKGSVTYTTNALGQVTQLTDWAGNPTTYAYSGTGQLATANVNAGTAFTSTYAYDTARRLSRITHAKGAANLLDLRYNGFTTGQNDPSGTLLQGRDQNGNIRGIFEQWAAETPITHAFGYDSLNRITNIQHGQIPANWGGGANPAVPAMILQSGAAGATGLPNAYDARGNATRFMGKSMDYDTSDRVSNVGFQFDANGNQLDSSGGAQSQTWNMVDPSMGGAASGGYSWGYRPVTWGYSVMEDVDGDGKMDLYQQATAGFRWRKGNGDGTFGGVLAHSNPSQTLLDYNTWGAADINGDGKLDAVTSDNSTRIKVGLYTGPGTFSSVTTTGAITSGCNIATYRGLDFNNDGKDDIFSRCGTTFQVRLGQANGTVSAPVTTTGAIAFTMTSSQLGFFDVNGDGKLDVVIAPSSTQSKVYFGTGTGTFTAASGTGTSNLSAALGRRQARSWANFDGAAGNELLISSHMAGGTTLNAYFVRFAADGSTSSQLVTASIPAGFASSYLCEGSDEDGDGKLDLLCAQYNTAWPWTQERILSFRNTSTGGALSFAAGVVIAAPRNATNPSTAPFEQYVTGGPLEPVVFDDSSGTPTAYFWKR